MYTQDDLNSAVASGAISADAAQALRAHVAEKHQMPTGDEENFRLLTGFNDIFVAIGTIIMLMAAGAIGQNLGGVFFAVPDFPMDPNTSDAAFKAYEAKARLGHSIGLMLGGALVAGTAWMLAEFFTRRRRMALPSIILLLAFVAGVFATLAAAAVLIVGDGNENDRLGAVLLAMAALGAAGGAWLHWRRFMVPITVAAGAAALAGTAIGLIVAAIGPDNLDGQGRTILMLVLAAGLAVFALAMRWDASDRERVTRRSDVAFWLHLLAAPMIAHPIFSLLGVTGGEEVGIGAALGVVAIYIAFALVALAIDRRALLVSALAYVLIALTWLFREFGAVELNFALTALVIGSALLTLSALWTPIRRAVVAGLPGGLQGRLPATA